MLKRHKYAIYINQIAAPFPNVGIDMRAVIASQSVTVWLIVNLGLAPQKKGLEPSKRSQKVIAQIDLHTLDPADTGRIIDLINVS